MDAVEVVAGALPRNVVCWPAPYDRRYGEMDDGERPYFAKAGIAALLAKGDGDPVVLMPADEGGRVEVRRAVSLPDPHCEDCEGEGWVEDEEAGGSSDCACMRGTDLARLVPIEDGEG